MKFTSQIATTPQQSKRLLKLGLKPDTADSMYTVMTVSYNGHFIEEDKRNYHLCLFNQDEVQTVGFCKYEKIPAWSLHRLLCLLPTEYITDIDFQQVMQDFIFRSQDMYDEVISCIETLIKESYFYKDYLEEKQCVR